MIIRRCAVALLLVATACSGEEKSPGSSGVDESKPFLQPDGPLRGIALVAEVSEDGSFSDPQLSFTTDDTEATAVVGLGDEVPADSTLTVAWYRLTGIDGREHLFSHKIPIGPGGHAFSQGVAEGGLAPGLYEVVATLADRQVRTPWVVHIATDVASPGGAGGALALPSRILAQVGEVWDVPDSGDSGWYDPQEPAGDPPPPGPCEIDRVSGGMDPLTTIRGYVYWLGACSQMTLTATVSGPPQTLVSKEIPAGSLSFLRADADVCELAGGSDLPGTTVQYTATGNEGATGTGSFTLPDLGEALVAAIESRPEEGSRVQEGDKIDLHGLGMVLPPALGVEKLDLLADGVLIDTARNASGSTQPEPCDLGRIFAEIVSSYRVPDGAPPVIEICAEVLGFDGNEDRGCIEFYTGEVWKGTVTGVSIEHAAPCRYPFNGEVTIVVAEDGEATMSATSTSSGTCRGVSASKSAPFELSGTRTSTGFEFPGPFPGMGPLNIATTDNHGSGTSTGFVGPTYEVTLDFDVECTSCESSG